MKEIIFLVCNKKGVKGIVYKNPPKLDPSELPIKITVTVEDKLFETPLLQDSITITTQDPSERVKELEFELNQLKNNKGSS